MLAEFDQSSLDRGQAVLKSADDGVGSGERGPGLGRLDRVAELLEQLAAAELWLGTKISELVFARAPGRAGVGEKAAGVAKNVEADVAEGNILLEFGRVRGGRGVALRGDGGGSLRSRN